MFFTFCQVLIKLMRLSFISSFACKQINFQSVIGEIGSTWSCAMKLRSPRRPEISGREEDAKMTSFMPSNIALHCPLFCSCDSSLKTEASREVNCFGLKNEWDVVGSDKKWALEIWEHHHQSASYFFWMWDVNLSATPTNKSWKTEIIVSHTYHVCTASMKCCRTTTRKLFPTWIRWIFIWIWIDCRINASYFL